MRVGIIVIGNEVLSGKVSDINSNWLIGQFHELGASVQKVSIIPDDVQVIAAEIQLFSETFEVVMTTGGVGPTHDDVTFAAVAMAFNRPLEHSTKLESIIQEQLPSASATGYLRMANLPAGTDLIFTPGLPFPVTKVANVYVMPGEPTVLRKKFLAIRETFRREPFVVKRIFLHIDEGEIAHQLDQLQSDYPQVEIGSYPVYENADYKVQITFEAKNGAEVLEAFEVFAKTIQPQDVWKTE
jgi:molybdenum cofactor synthesis domain-containing protein